MRSILLVFLGACSYGVLSTFVKLAYADGFAVNGVTGSQMLIGAVMMWIIAYIVYRIQRRRHGEAGKPATAQSYTGHTAPKIALKTMLLLAVVGSTTGLTGIFYYSSLQYIPASLAIVLLFQFTWIGVLLEAVLDRKWPGKEKLAALLLLFIGTALAGGIVGEGFHRFTLNGIILGLLAAVAYTLFILFSGRTANHIAPVTRSSIMLTGSLVLVFIVYPPTFLWSGELFHGLFLWGFLLALFGAVVPTLFFTIGVPYIGGGLATILGAAELPTAVFMSRLVLQESVSPVQWAGVALILFGVALPELSKRRQRKVS